MENGQNVQNELSQSQTSKPELRKVKPKLISSGNILIHTFVKYHWLFLIGFLGLLIGGATISLRSLTHVEQLKSERADRITVEVTQPVTPPRKSNPVPLWMVAAIALSCASGCLVLCRLLRGPVKPRKYRRWKNRDNSEPIAQKNSSLRRRKRTFVRSPQAQLAQNNTYRNRATQIPPMKRVPVSKQPIAKILPPQPQRFSHVNQEFKTREFKTREFKTQEFKTQEFKTQEFKTRQPLADRMDLRQENSLSAILQKSNLSAK